jgi:diacylglycerol kinase family enzyme
MVNARQRKEIKHLMRRIKDAKDQGKPKKVIEQRARELEIYLKKEGIKNPYE